ncbi:MAG: MarC family protein [Betaproteobacteria bacterium]
MLDGLLPFSGYARFLVTLTAVLDPFLAVPIFLALTASRSAAERARLVRVVAVTVFAVLAVSGLVGEQLLQLVGASLPAFRVGGGLVLLLMALAMLNAQAGGVRQSQDEARELESGELSGVVPLAVPLLAGPGAISTTIIAAQAGGAAHFAALVGCILAVCALTWITLSLAGPIGAKLGTTGLNIATRLLGLLLAALAIQTMAEGLRQLFPGLA